MRMHFLLKRCLDVCCASVALVVLGPLLMFVAIAIKMTSSGPVLFVQPREGRHGQLFNAYKFRSMYQELCDGSGIRHTCDGDPRITPVGRFIRKTSIDELPQILNVLKGEMSLVGPRPHVPGMLVLGRPYSDVVPYYAERHAMRPGITGLAQASGLRGEVSSLHLAKARVDFDIAYTQNFSIWLDLTILWRTALREFVTGNGV